MTLAENLDKLEVMVAEQASPDKVGRLVLMALAKSSAGHASFCARCLLVSDFDQHFLPQSEVTKTLPGPILDAVSTRRGRIR
jgi:hypothetical protein